MPVRTDLSNTARNTQMALSRATIRSVNTKNLAPEITHADSYHSHTDTDFEIAHPWGSVAIPLDQEETSQKTTAKYSKDQKQQGDWSHDQPTGKAAEVVMSRLGSYSHPVAIPLADRRVQPMGLKAGAYINYAPSGTGQVMYHNEVGSYLVAVNNPPEQSDKQDEIERFASLRHVIKKKQNREIDGEGKLKEDPSSYKHEGESVNMEVRATKTRIEFRAGDAVVGYYEGGKWVFLGDIYLGDVPSEKMKQVHRKDDLDDAGDKAQTHAKKVWAL